jgi:hypothetical protein
MIIEWVARGRPLSVVLTADTGVEREETYAYLPIFQRWMDRHHIEHHIVRYVPKRFKHWPPYFSLLENCLTNATLPSISFGRHSCSQKWKIQPQDQWVAGWGPARKYGPEAARLSSLSAMTTRPPTAAAMPIAKAMSATFMTIAIRCANGSGTVTPVLPELAPRGCPCPINPLALPRTKDE